MQEVYLGAHQCRRECWAATTKQMNDVEKTHRRMDMRRNETKNAATRQKLAEIEKLEADARDWELADASVAATTLGAEANAARENPPKNGHATK